MLRHFCRKTGVYHYSHYFACFTNKRKAEDNSHIHVHVHHAAATASTGRPWAGYSVGMHSCAAQAKCHRKVSKFVFFWGAAD